MLMARLMASKLVVQRLVTTVVIAMLLLLPASVIHAEQKKWWHEHDDGWFFYDDPALMVETKKEPAPEPQKDPEPKEETKPLPTEKPLLASEQLKRKGEELLSNAVTEPTEENVKAYMAHNKQMIDQADRFALLWQAMLMKYPELSKNVSTDMVAKETEDSVRGLRYSAAILFVYSSTCPYCQKVAPNVAEFQRKYDFTVLPVSMDGIALPEFANNTLSDNGISTRLGIETVPAIFLAFPGENRFEHLATGFVSTVELERKIYQLEKTRGMLQQ